MVIVAMFDRDSTVPGVDTIYVADDQPAPAGGIQKWTLSGNSWSLVATLNLATGPAGFRGIAGTLSASGLMLVASTADPSANRLVVFLDDGVTTPSGAVVASSPPNTVFRGVALSPHD